MAIDISNLRIPLPEPPKPVERPRGLVRKVDADALLRVGPAREALGVDGRWLCAAVLDTGLRLTHVDFADRVPAQKNFTRDNRGNEDDAADDHGHGTHVSGLIAADGVHLGVAPGANVVPIKVLSNAGGDDFTAVEKALAWVLDHHARHCISVVSMAFAGPSNLADDSPYREAKIGELIRRLHAQGIAVVAAAGNGYAPGKREGMSFPAVYREVISVGAAYDAPGPGFEYASGVRSTTSAPDQIAPFSQRLGDDPERATRTTVLGPGAPVTSSGNLADEGASIQSGTSRAAPVVAGVVLLMQQLYVRTTGRLPPVDLLVECLRTTGVAIVDDDRGADNVPHTGKPFPRVDALGALTALQQSLHKKLFATAR
jgi:subtilisin family serine protease